MSPFIEAARIDVVDDVPDPRGAVARVREPRLIDVGYGDDADAAGLRETSEVVVVESDEAERGELPPVVLAPHFARHSPAERERLPPPRDAAVAARQRREEKPSRQE